MANVSFLTQVIHGQVDMATSEITPVLFGPTTVPPQPMVTSRAPSPAGYSTLHTRPQHITTTLLTFQRQATAGSHMFVRYQLIEWKIGRQP